MVSAFPPPPHSSSVSYVFLVRKEEKSCELNLQLFNVGGRELGFSLEIKFQVKQIERQSEVRYSIFRSRFFFKLTSENGKNGKILFLPF